MKRGPVMPGRHVSPRRCIVVWRMYEGGASRVQMNDYLKRKFGEEQSIADRTLGSIIKRGREHGDPCWRAPRIIAGRTLTSEHDRTIFNALEDDASTMTAELVV